MSINEIDDKNDNEIIMSVTDAGTVFAFDKDTDNEKI